MAWNIFEKFWNSAMYFFIILLDFMIIFIGMQLQLSSFIFAAVHFQNQEKSSYSWDSVVYVLHVLAKKTLQQILNNFMNCCFTNN